MVRAQKIASMSGPTSNRSGMSLVPSSILWTTFLLLLAAPSASQLLTTISGRILPWDEVQQRVPHLSRHLLRTAVYEQTPQGDLANEDHVLRVRRVAPHFERVLLEREIVSESDGEENILTELITRTGPDATFVYGNDGRSILAGWGGDFNIQPLNRRDFPGVFINNRAGEVLPSFVLDSIAEMIEGVDTVSSTDEFPEVRTERESALTSIGSWFTEKMEESSEKEARELELFVIHEKTFCKSFASSSESHKVIAAHVARLQDKFKGTGIVPGASRISGPCAIDEKLGLPEKVKNCPKDSSSCSRTALLLNYYRTYDAFTSRRRDLTIVFTNYSSQDETFDGIIGAAYVGATCNRKFGWAWVHHTNVNDIVLAHEVAHSLGALHEDEGIMKPSVGNETVNVQFSPKSIGLMNQFIDKASTDWCLKRLKWNDNGLKLAIPQSFIPKGILVHDVSFAKFYGQAKTSVLVGLTSKAADGYNVKVAMLPDVGIVAGEVSNGPWMGPYDGPSAISVQHGGVGVAFGHIRSKESNDIIIGYIKSDTVVEYIAGFGITIDDKNGLKAEIWTEANQVPIPVSMDFVKSVGLALGDIEQDGNVDLAVAYILGKNNTRFTIGRDVGSDGQVKGGWSKDQLIKPALSSVVNSVSVSFLKTPGENFTNIAFYTNEQLGTRLHRYYRVATEVAPSGSVKGGWTTAIPAQIAPINAIYGGLAIDSIDGSNELTTVVVQTTQKNVSEGQSFSYLDFEFNITAAILADKDGSIFESILYGRDAGCTECYQGTEKDTCLERMKLCEERKYENFKNSEAWSASVRQDETSYKNTVYCAGFHKVFISPEGDTCDRNSSREYITGEGMTVLLRVNVEQLIDENETLSEVDKDFDTTSIIDYDANAVDSTAESGRTVKIFRPNKMRLQLKRGNNLWKEMVQEALQRIRKQSDVDLTFKNVQTSQVRKRGNGVFIVVLKFNENFRKEYVEKEIWRPYGTSASTW